MRAARVYWRTPFQFVFPSAGGLGVSARLQDTRLRRPQDIPSAHEILSARPILIQDSTLLHLMTSNAPVSLATPGSPEYLQSILHKISDTHPELPLDPVILQSILLCLIAGRYHENHGQCTQTHTRSKNLILRTKEEDVGMVLNIVAMVSDMWPSFKTLSIGLAYPAECTSPLPAAWAQERLGAAVVCLPLVGIVRLLGLRDEYSGNRSSPSPHVSRRVPH